MGIGALINSRLVRRYGTRRLSHGALCCNIVILGAVIPLVIPFDEKPPLLLFCAWIALACLFLSLTLPNFNAIAMQPLGDIVGTVSSFVGFFTMLIGALCGLVVGQDFDGTVLPWAIGFFVLNGSGLAVVIWMEGGRLFKPHQPDLRD